MNLFLANTSPLAVASFYVGALVLVMLGLKVWTGLRRGQLKVPPGDNSNLEFNRALRVQHNAVEDVPPLMVGLLALGLLEAPLWLVHGVGALLVVSRVLHAIGLAGSGGFSIGRSAGTMGTLVSYLAIAGALITLSLMWAT